MSKSTNNNPPVHRDLIDDVIKKVDLVIAEGAEANSAMKPEVPASLTRNIMRQIVMAHLGNSRRLEFAQVKKKEPTTETVAEPENPKTTKSTKKVDKHKSA